MMTLSRCLARGLPSLGSGRTQITQSLPKDGCGITASLQALIQSSGTFQMPPH